MKRPLIAAALALTLTGCATAPNSGEVIAREYQPARTYMSCVLINKVCYMQPRTDDEDWMLLIRDGEHEGWVEVAEETWNDQPIGSHWQGDAS